MMCFRTNHGTTLALMKFIKQGGFMKKLILVLVLAAAGSTSFAATGEKASVKDFTFKYKYHNDTYEVRKPSSSYEEAFASAATACFNHFKNADGTKLTEDKGLDIIDVCANPRS